MVKFWVKDLPLSKKKGWKNWAHSRTDWVAHFLSRVIAPPHLMGRLTPHAFKIAHILQLILQNKQCRTSAHVHRSRATCRCRCAPAGCKTRGTGTDPILWVTTSLELRCNCSYQTHQVTDNIQTCKLTAVV